MLQRLEQLLEQANTLLSEQQKEGLLVYVALLNQWNQTYNLTAVRAPEQMLIRHILDSLVVLPFLSGKRFIDVGTGAGLPGIPLAIAAPETHFTLLDSLGKRISFLQQVKTRLQLKNITLIHSRAETYRPPQGFDGVISRAFTSLAKMLCWCHPLTAPEGHFYALKGAVSPKELAEIPSQFNLLKIISLKVPELIEQRHLVILKYTPYQPKQHC